MSGRPRRSGSSRSGSGSGCSPSRLIQTIFSPSSRAGATSWKRLAATWTWCSRSAVVSSKKRSQWPCAGLYEPIVLGGDDEVERHADPLLRLGDQRVIGVGEDREVPAARAAARRAPRGTSRKAGQSGSELRQRARSPLPGSPGRSRREPLERQREHLRVAAVRLRLHLRLELVVAGAAGPAPLGAEEALEHAADAGVPVDQRAVAVEGRPAGHGPELIGAAVRESADAGSDGRRLDAEARDSTGAAPPTSGPPTDGSSAAVGVLSSRSAAEATRRRRDLRRGDRTGTRRRDRGADLGGVGRQAPAPSTASSRRCDGEVVGWCAVVPYSSRAVYRGVGEESVYVAERARGRGVGQALLAT